MGPKIELIPSAQRIPRSVGEHRQLPAIEWSAVQRRPESNTKFFTSGRDTRWECNKSKGFHANNDIWDDDPDDGLEVSLQDKADLGLLRIWIWTRVVNFACSIVLALSSIKAATISRELFIYTRSAEYKKPGTNEVWSHSDRDFDGDFYNTSGTFFHNIDFDRDEITMQGGGIHFESHLFQLRRTATNGTTPTGGGPYTEVQIFNLKLGWGDGEASNNHRICLPKIRPFDQAAQLQFG